MTRHLLFVSRAYSFAILRPLAAAIERRGGEARWFVHGLDAGDYLGAGERALESTAAVRAFDPQAVFAPGNWVPDFFPGAKVQVFHGFGIDKRGHFRIRGLFDLYCTHGPLTTGWFSAASERLGHFRVVETGWPKMDPLFVETARARELRAAAGRPVVLYAPTFSTGLGSAPALREHFEQLAAAGSYRVLVKFHPRQDAGTVAAYRAIDGLSVLADTDIVPVLQAADVLVSDTSSVVAEFLLLERPVVTFRAAKPGPHTLDIVEPGALPGAIEQALARPAALMEAGREYAQAMHPYRDGRSSERVLDAVAAFVEHDAGTLRPRPLNLKRRLQIRRRMGYYRWR